MPPTPVLFVHAFPFDSRMWKPQIDAIGSSRPVLAPNLRGFGEAAAGPFPTSLDQHARDLCDLLDRSGAVRAIIVGLSMGGYAALALARLAPDRIAALMLCDTKADPDSDDGKRARTARIARLQREGIGLLPDEMIPGLVAAHASAELKLELRRMILQQDVRGVEAALAAMRDRSDSTPLLPSIRVPTALVCGEHDTLTPPSTMQSMGQRILGATFTLVGGAGHMSNLEAPELFNRALMDLIARAP
jgi:3-oxoadipate enol-lactonase